VAAIGFSQFPSLIDKIQMRNGGWTNPYFASLVKYIPQSIGAFFGGIIIVFFRAKYITKDKTVFIAAPTLRNIVDGFIYAIGMICYLYAAFLLNSNTNKAIIGNDGIDAGGSTTAFALTNFANIVSALGGVFILKEKFTKREVLYFIIGTIILTVGAILVTFTDVFTFLKIWGKTTPIVS
jgi:glucose uptake protein